MNLNYFATKSTDELLPELFKRIDIFHQYKERTGDAKKWRKSYDLYYGNHIKSGDGTDIAHVGEDGELTAYGINYYRNLVTHVLALTCSTKPAYDFKAKNSDLRSQQQARLANNIIDSYLVEKRMGRHMKQAAERALVFKEGFTYTYWDPTLGNQIGAVPVLDENGEIKKDNENQSVLKVKYEGDPSIISKSPWDVIRDVTLRDWSKCKWVIVREFENKFDLAAQYPEKADDILSSGTNSETEKIYNYTHKLRNFENETDDLIPVYHFYHLKTDSLKAGRYTKCINSKLALYDGPYQYRNALPVQRITPGEMFDTADGYSAFYDIMVLQQVLNLIYSTILTNQTPLGTPVLWLPDGCNLNAEQIAGLAVLKGGLPGSEPKTILFGGTSPEVFKNGEAVEGHMQKLSGINSAVTGDSNLEAKSGVAIGRLQAMAIQFSSNFQQSWAEIQEDCGTFLLHILQDYADTKRMTSLAGKANKGAMASWSKEDIDQVDRLTCDLGNPLFRTMAGRQDMADKWLEKGLIKDPTKYIEVIETGSIEPMEEAPRSRLELIRKENEMLMEGKQVIAMVGDSHVQHSQEHRVILDDPAIRTAANAGDPLAAQIVKLTQDHIMEHNQLQNTQDPFWFVVSGEQPPPPPAMPPPPLPGGPGQSAPEAGAGPQAAEPPPQDPSLPPMPPPVPPSGPA
jgi:hypothetical protein